MGEQYVPNFLSFGNHRARDQKDELMAADSMMGLCNRRVPPITDLLIRTMWAGYVSTKRRLVATRGVFSRESRTENRPWKNQGDGFVASYGHDDVTDD